MEGLNYKIETEQEAAKILELFQLYSSGSHSDEFITNPLN
jgi:hypothetical protein